MRVIKFRAWYKGEMHEVYSFHLSAGMVTISLPRFPFVQDVVSDTVMEYTGLSDKNGKEIYEGDVVKWWVNNITRTSPVEYVEQQASFWMMKDIDSGHSVINDWMRGEYEIIGNIHENPELINTGTKNK